MKPAASHSSASSASKPRKRGSAARSRPVKHRCWLFSVHVAGTDCNEHEVHDTLTSQYTAVKEIKIERRPDQHLIRMLFKGPQPAKGLTALLRCLYEAESVDASPIVLRRGRKPQAPKVAKSEAVPTAPVSLPQYASLCADPGPDDAQQDTLYAEAGTPVDSGEESGSDDDMEGLPESLNLLWGITYDVRLTGLQAEADMPLVNPRLVFGGESAASLEAMVEDIQQMCTDLENNPAQAAPHLGAPYRG